MNHLELFAGIGGFRQALTLLSQDFGIEQNTVGFSEIDDSAVKSYKAIYDTTNEVEMGDIVAFNQDINNIANGCDKAKDICKCKISGNCTSYFGFGKEFRSCSDSIKNSDAFILKRLENLKG